MANEVSTTPASSDLEAREKQPLPQEGTRPGPVFRPDADILEENDAYTIYADLPGVDENHVNVHLENGVLAIDAELAATPDPAWRPLHTEYRVGGFHREFRLSDTIDVSNVSASMHDGVLALRLPKTERHRPRRIEIRGA